MPPRSAARQRRERPHTSRQVGNYVLSKTLGEGTFGKVRLGVHTLTGEKVAIKVLEKDRIVDKGDIKRVTREIQILKRVRHPHVVRLLEVIEKPRHIYLVTEYLAGGELFEFIVANKRLPEPQARPIFRQVRDLRESQRRAAPSPFHKPPTPRGPRGSRTGATR